MDIYITVTAFYASLLMLLYIGLSFNIIRLRFKHRIGLGDGGKEPLTKAIRVHGNFAEYMPLALILLAGFELNNTGSLWVHVFGGGLFIGRVLHAIGISKSIGTSAPRFLGVISTFTILLLLAIANIYAFIF